VCVAVLWTSRHLAGIVANTELITDVSSQVAVLASAGTVMASQMNSFAAQCVTDSTDSLHTPMLGMLFSCGNSLPASVFANE
jgi:hypothetical protein